MIITEPKGRDGATKYHIIRRPILLELLAATNFADPPTPSDTSTSISSLVSTLGGLLRSSNDGDRSLSGSLTGPGLVYPFEISHAGGRGGPIVLYAESEDERAEWNGKIA